jgi:FMN phosphatase YigB (HAD superfamily)
MQNEKIIYVFDLDYTLLPSAKYNGEYKKGDYENLYFLPNAKKVLEKLGKEKCILLTFDRYGDQFKKLDHLKVENYFQKIIVVTEKNDKGVELEKIKDQYVKVVVVGDRYEDGELYHALKLGMRTVCIDLPGGMYPATLHHEKFDLVIQEEKDFEKMI